ncbi:flavoprotein [Auraticoccus monumenti]|uniref:Flavoprotein n=1 Tax=Auraticoccus monumenti TaxID=675864 RepID=A0A1G6VLS7_9ACTN|nr:flavoprotein [Auraticoccus monumenti]SDD54363.1 Flavoprotein [Auraticoccus monumenti]
MRTIGVVAAAAAGAHTLREGLVQPLVEQGQRVTVTLTPTARTWFDHLGETAALEDLTGWPVRSAPRVWGAPRPHPDPDLLVAAPLTANTCAKLALGLGDNQALTVLCEGITVLPTVVFPRVNAAHTRHPAWEEHLRRLRAAGAHLVQGDDVWPLDEPRLNGTERPLPWSHIIETVQRLLPAV